MKGPDILAYLHRPDVRQALRELIREAVRDEIRDFVFDDLVHLDEAAEILEWDREPAGARTPPRLATVDRYLAECCVTDVDGARTRTTALYAAYRHWAESQDARPLSNAQFGRELRQRGLGALRGHRAKFYPIGILRDGGDADD